MFEIKVTFDATPALLAAVSAIINGATRATAAPTAPVGEIPAATAQTRQSEPQTLKNGTRPQPAPTAAAPGDKAAAAQPAPQGAEAPRELTAADVRKAMEGARERLFGVAVKPTDPAEVPALWDALNETFLGLARGLAGKKPTELPAEARGEFIERVALLRLEDGKIVETDGSVPF